MQYFVLVHALHSTVGSGGGGYARDRGALTMFRSGVYIPCTSVDPAVAVDRDVSLQALYRHRRLTCSMGTNQYVFFDKDVLKSQDSSQWDSGSPATFLAASLKS